MSWSEISVHTIHEVMINMDLCYSVTLPTSMHLQDVIATISAFCDRDKKAAESLPLNH